MKLKMYFLLCVCFSSLALAQEKRTNFSEGERVLGGDVALKSSYEKVFGSEIQKVFEIECMEDGLYYLDAWILPPLTEEGFPEYKVEINGVLSESSFKPQVSDWQSLALTDANKSAATVKLRKGVNRVSVIGKNVGVPLVDFIKLSLNSLNAGFSDKDYRDFKEKIRTNTLFDEKDMETHKVETRSNRIDEVSLRGTAGEIYDYKINMPVYFTPYVPLCCYAGDNVVITTTQSGNFNHVIEFFERDNGVNYSWVSSSSGNGTLTVSIPFSSWYVLRVRSYNSSASGTVNITISGITYMSTQSLPNSPITCTAIPLTQNYAQLYGSVNYFTCKVKNSGNTLLFLADNSSPGKIVAHNDDGGIINGYDWGQASFINTSKQVSVGMVSATYSLLPSFESDVYLGLKSGSSLFNPPVSNCFISGNPGNYQCFDWAVGLTSPLQVPYNSISDSLLWDAFFSSYGYVRCYGADTVNAAIALWTLNGQFSHASVRKHSMSSLPHGFEWESKLGGSVRLMHTKTGLSYTFGNIKFHYKPMGTFKSSLSVDDNNDEISTRSFSPQQSLINPELNKEYRLTQTDLNRIAMFIDLLPTQITVDFEKKYLTWVNTWSRPEIIIHSNPNKYAESDEYEDLVEFCLKYGKSIWPLIIDKFAHPEVSGIKDINLLRDLTYKRGIDVDFWGDIQRPYFEAYKWISTYACFVDYCSKLLADEYENIFKSIREITDIENEETEPNFVTVQNQEILLKLYSENGGKAYVKIYNLYGGLEYESSYTIPKGGQSFIIDASKFNKGIYVIKITIGDKTTSQRIFI